jgi:hypothetical protein
MFENQPYCLKTGQVICALRRQRGFDSNDRSANKALADYYGKLRALIQAGILVALLRKVPKWENKI